MATLKSKIAKAIINPRRAVEHLLFLSRGRWVANFASHQKMQYFSIRQTRSVSDNGSYAPFVASAVKDPVVFEKFRSHPTYCEILEHLSEADGRKYLDDIVSNNPAFLEKIDDLKLNDLVGAPITYKYAEVGAISPTTLRYIKVASDLKNYFKSDIGAKVVEIGVGYGGQMLIIDKLFDIVEYHLYDLPPVLDLASRYLESYTLNSSYKIVTLNQCSGSDSYDMAISNYAFSELTAMSQRTYIRKILSKSKRGYLTMNSGLDGSVYTDDKLSVQELRSLLPAFEVVKEAPLTAPENYIIIWGHG